LYRLAGAIVRVPALRERGADVVLLAHVFLERLNREHGQAKTFAAATLEWYRSHRWPGNVRELQNAVARAFVLAPEEELLPPAAAPRREGAETAPGDPASTVRPLADLEIEAIERALIATGGDKTHAAKLLGISRTALYDKLRRSRASEA
jgi:DNA-binding NtrC family response regulator